MQIEAPFTGFGLYTVEQQAVADEFLDDMTPQMSFSTGDVSEDSLPNTPDDTLWSGRSMSSMMTPLSAQSPSEMSAAIHDASELIPDPRVQGGAVELNSYDFYGLHGPNIGSSHSLYLHLQIPDEVAQAMQHQVQHSHQNMSQSNRQFENETQLSQEVNPTVMSMNQSYQESTPDQSVCSEDTRTVVLSGRRRSRKIGRRQRGGRSQRRSSNSSSAVSTMTDSNRGRWVEAQKARLGNDTHIANSGKLPCEESLDGGETCGRRFQRNEHLKRHLKIHLPEGEKRKFWCAMAFFFGTWLCPKGLEPIKDRSDNMYQHCATHCYGHSVNGSRNPVFHREVVNAIDRVQLIEQGLGEKADAKIASVNNALRKKIRTNMDNAGKNRLDDNWTPRSNAHISHEIMTDLFPEGFVSCESLEVGSGPTNSNLGPEHDFVDRRVPWCFAMIKIKGAPEPFPAEARMELTTENSLDGPELLRCRRNEAPESDTKIRSRPRMSKI